MALSMTFATARICAPWPSPSLPRPTCRALAALADGHDEVALAEDRIAVAHLAADLDDRWDARELLDPVASGIAACALVPQATK